MERIGADIMGPLSPSAGGNVYILVLVEYFTKWAEAYALPDHKAPTVARAIVENFVCRFGTPVTIHTDQGREFQSATFREVVRLLGVRQSRTCPFNPKSDGMVERCNRTIEALLAMVVREDQRDWDRQLPFVMAAYRATEHASSGVSTNAMMLGRETAAPLSLLYPMQELEGLPPGEGYVAELQKLMAEAHDLARGRLGRAVERQRRNYDQRAVLDVIAEGEEVYFYHPIKKTGRSPKLQRYWTGPWRVVRHISGPVYEIRMGRKTRVEHYDNLKVVPGTGSEGPEVVAMVTRAGKAERRPPGAPRPGDPGAPPGDEDKAGRSKRVMIRGEEKGGNKSPYKSGGEGEEGSEMALHAREADNGTFYPTILSGMEEWDSGPEADGLSATSAL